MITDIYRIKTRNSIYEIQGDSSSGLSRCRKEGSERGWKQVRSKDLSYLEDLCIGPSFDIPGVVLTSRVQDYVHFVPSKEEKKTVTQAFFGMLAEHVKEQANPTKAVRVVGPEDY